MIVIDWIGVEDTNEDELTEDRGEALSDTRWGAVWETIGLWEDDPSGDADLVGISETDALCVVDDEILTEVEPE